MLPRAYQRRRPYGRRVGRNVRNIHRAMRTLTRRDHGRERGHHPPARPARPRAAMPTRTTEHQIATDSAYSAALAQTFERTITMPPIPDLRAPPCERSYDRRAAAHGTVYVPPWVEMERPSQPNVAHMDAIQRQLRRKRARDPRGSPSGAPASPATCACRTRPRHSATARSNDTNLYNAPTATDRVASHPHTIVWPPAPPLSPHRQSETARAESFAPTHM